MTRNVNTTPDLTVVALSHQQTLQDSSSRVSAIQRPGVSTPVSTPLSTVRSDTAISAVKDEPSVARSNQQTPVLVPADHFGVFLFVHQSISIDMLCCVVLCCCTSCRPSRTIKLGIHCHQSRTAEVQNICQIVVRVTKRILSYCQHRCHNDRHVVNHCQYCVYQCHIRCRP